MSKDQKHEFWKLFVNLTPLQNVLNPKRDTEGIDSTQLREVAIR